MRDSTLEFLAKKIGENQHYRNWTPCVEGTQTREWRLAVLESAELVAEFGEELQRRCHLLGMDPDCSTLDILEAKVEGDAQ